MGTRAVLLSSLFIVKCDIWRSVYSVYYVVYNIQFLFYSLMFKVYNVKYKLCTMNTYLMPNEYTRHCWLLNESRQMNLSPSTALCSVQCAVVCSVQCAVVCSVQCAVVCSVQQLIISVQCSVYSVLFAAVSVNRAFSSAVHSMGKGKVI